MRCVGHEATVDKADQRSSTEGWGRLVAASRRLTFGPFADRTPSGELYTVKIPITHYGDAAQKRTCMQQAESRLHKGWAA